MAASLIVFVTNTDEPNPLLRVGLPIASRQIVCREQDIFALGLRALTAPFESVFTLADIAPAAATAAGAPRGKGGKGGAKGAQLKRAMILSMRLCWQILRECSSNKRYYRV